MSTSQVLDRTFHLYRNYFLLFAGISIITPALALMVELGFAALGYAPGSRMHLAREQELIMSLLYSFSILVIALFGGALAQGAAVYAVSKVYLGESITIGESFKSVLGRFGTILRIFISISLRISAPYLIVVLVFVLLFASIGAMGGRGGPGAAALFGIGALLGLLLLIGAFVWSLYLYSKYALAIPACLLEKLGATDAIRRSGFLTQGSIMRIVLIFILLGVLTLVLNLVLSLPSEIYAFQHHNLMTLPLVLWKYLANFFASALAGPVATIAIALVFYDQKVRKEAFDLQLMMQALEPLPQPGMATNASVGQ